MINQKQKLNPWLFDKDVEMAAMRQGFGEGLLAAAEKNSRVVGLTADLLESTFMHLFARKFPERFVETGVAEQNLAAVASGLAASGKIPFISSFAIFSPGRNWEQIRTTICYNSAPVKIVGSHAGLSAAADGGSHQALEDVALMRVLPRMTVLSPCDALEAKKATAAAVEVAGPVYLRFVRDRTPVITTEETPFSVGRAEIFFRSEGKQSEVEIVATGSSVFHALRAAAELEKEGIAVSVVNLSTIKPLDRESIITLAKEAGAVVTVEEHQVAGGMGSAVAECLAENFPVPVEFVGVFDQFGQSGEVDELISFYGLDLEAIKKAVKKVLTRKGG